MATQKHIHKFRRHKHKSGNIVFFCVLPDCNTKINPVFALGKRSLCWRCEEPFLMNEYSIRLAKPHCENCHKSKDIRIKKELIGVIDPEAKASKIVSTTSLADRLQQTINRRTEESEDDI